MSDVITLHVDEPQPITLDYIDAKIKPETVGHATPTEQAQTVTPAPGTTFSAVEVDAIPSEYIKPTGTVNITENGEIDVREFASALVAVPQPSGKITITENGIGLDIADYAEADVSVLPNLQTPNPITPTKSQQTVTPEAGYDGLAQTVVEPIPSEYIVPAGKITLTENATDVDVSQYAEADVAVPVPVMPEEYSIGGSLIDNTAESYHIGDNVTYIRDYAFYQSHIEYLQLPQGVIKISGNAFQESYLESIEFPDTVASLGPYMFNRCKRLTTITFNQKNINANSNHCLYATSLKTLIFSENVESFTFATGGLQALPNTITLFDFSRCKNIVAISSYDLPHANGCVIRVPSALLSDWQNETNWNALTNIVWEGV